VLIISEGVILITSLRCPTIVLKQCWVSKSHHFTKLSFELRKHDKHRIRSGATPAHYCVSVLRPIQTLQLQLFIQHEVVSENKAVGN